jgi:hypothetical protein
MNHTPTEPRPRANASVGEGDSSTGSNADAKPVASEAGSPDTRQRDLIRKRSLALSPTAAEAESGSSHGWNTSSSSQTATDNDPSEGKGNFTIHFFLFTFLFPYTVFLMPWGVVYYSTGSNPVTEKLSSALYFFFGFPAWLIWSFFSLFFGNALFLATLFLFVKSSKSRILILVLEVFAICLFFGMPLGIEKGVGTFFIILGVAFLSVLLSSLLFKRWI